MRWMLLPYKRYFDFEGRSRRMEYWMFSLFYFLACCAFALLLVLGIAMEGSVAAADQPGPFLWVLIGLFVLFLLGSVIPSIAVSVRRFHDQGRSGWMYLISFMPYVGWIIVLVFMCLEGTRGVNEFGPDPKDPTGASVFA